MESHREIAVMLLVLGGCFAVDAIRCYRTGLIEYDDEDDASKSRTYLRDETPKMFLLHIVLGALAALGCVGAGIFGWNHDLGEILDRVSDGLSSWFRR